LPEECINKKISKDIKKKFFENRVRRVGYPGYKSPFKNLQRGVKHFASAVL